MSEDAVRDRSFPKERRILKRKDFRLVYDTGTPYRNAGFHLFLKTREEDRGPMRLGLTASRAVGKSVVRNRLRRWAREFFRLAQPRLRAGCDVVLNFHASLAQKDRREFDRLLEHVFGKAHLFER